ncbi:MAG: hypothetical protein HY881_16605 [Deltaproteobacteria bacterium]|nr:hypothetical protein [Deltaproteobacteria bacterium]
MTIQWPDERGSENRQQFGNRAIDPKHELRRLVEVCPAGLPSTFDQAVEWIAQQGKDISELEQRMNAVSNELELAELPESVNILMAWACAEALAKTPSLQTWQNVRNLKSHSWQLEHWLSDAMMVCAEDKISTKDAYIKLAKEIFEALDAFQLTSQFDRNNKEREQFRATWNENYEKLDEVWWGLRWWHEMNYEEEFPLFNVLGTLDPVGFINVVSESKNPYLVSSALLAVGAFRKFSLWEKLAVTAPSAFVDDGTWNESVTMPLLLVMARDQLLQAGRHIPHFDASDTEVEKVKQEIAKLTDAVITTLTNRQDALPLFARWSTWLIRQLLMQGIKDAENVRSSAFVDAAMIEAIGRELQGKTVSTESPSDAPAWEKWCYRCVLASHANSGFTTVPDCNNFLKEWAINLDDWTDKRGRQLREYASLIVTLNKEVPGDAAHLLASPIAMSESPTNTWIGLWDVTQSLREIVEFGDADALEPDEYQTRAEAGRLLFLVFCMGLAVLDQRVSQLSGDSPQARDLAKLHEALALAVREMREIDDTLNVEQWLQAVRHLAVRRLIWEDRVVEFEEDGRFRIFLHEDKPTFNDYLSAAKNDVMELLAILHSTLLNESNHQIVLDKLNAASIDLSNVIATAKRLNDVSARRYPIDEAQLRSLISK